MRSALRTLIFVFLVVAIVAICTSKADAARATPEQELMVIEEAVKHGVDPDMALAIIEVESNFNAKAVGALGEVGLFQLRKEFHGVAASFDERTNVEGGVKYLSTLFATCQPKYGDAWIICYNQGPYAKKLKHPKLNKYYKRVTALYEARKHAANLSSQTVPYDQR